MDTKIYLEALELLEDCSNVIFCSSLDLKVPGFCIDTITLEPTWDGGEEIKFYAGNPLDEDDEYWEELILSDEQKEEILKVIIVEY